MNSESLSALLDGECSPSELDHLLGQMDRDPALRERFGRMALSQELRRGARVSRVPADFADRVMAALPARPDATLVRLPARWSWQPLAGLAAAAAVGAVAVLVIKPDPGAGPADPAIATPAVAEAPAPADDRRMAELDDENARQLRNYLMAYSQSRAQQGMGGTLGYARYAAYTDDRKDGSR